MKILKELWIYFLKQMGNESGVFTAFIPLIASGLDIAYDSIWGQSSRNDYANQQAELTRQDLDFRMKSWEEQKALIAQDNATKKGAYDFAVAEYNKKEIQRKDYMAKTEAALNEPTYKYDQNVVKSNVDLVTQELDQQMAEQRPQVLENLATRGVRTSGISETALAPINKAYTEGLATATTKYTLEELLAQRAAETQRYNDRLKYLSGVAGTGGTMPSAPGTSLNPATPDSSSYYNAQNDVNALPLYQNQINANYLNRLLNGAGYAYNNANTGGANDSLSTNLGLRSSNPNLNLNYNPYGGR